MMYDIGKLPNYLVVLFSAWSFFKLERQREIHLIKGIKNSSFQNVFSIDAFTSGIKSCLLK